MKLFVFASLATAAAREMEYVGSKPTAVATIGEKVEAYYPYESVEDFFTWSGVGKEDMEVLGETRCAAQGSNEKVYKISDGKQDRCFVTVKPSSGKGPFPVLFFAHGSGGNAGNCGNKPDEKGKTWVETANSGGFVFICGEALQYSATNENVAGGPPLQGGLWEIPEVFTNSTGQKCNASDSFDNVYMSNMLAELAKEPETYDVSKFFVTGCSMGSAFTVWQGPCQHSLNPSSVTAFSTHSTGLKKKGDGLKFPPDTYNTQYEWGECPDCEYWPNVFTEKTDGLKACIFDNTADPTSQHPDFYTSSQHLASTWDALGNRKAETHFGSGGHCEQHDFNAIATCLDDGTGRLMPGGSHPSPGAKPSPAPSHHPAPHHPPAPHHAPSPSTPGPATGTCDEVVHKECPGETGAQCMQCTAQHSAATHAACKTLEEVEKACNAHPPPGPGHAPSPGH